MRNLLSALQAPVEYQGLTRCNPISTRELVRRAKAATRQRETERQEALDRQRTEAASEGAKVICNWLREIGFTGPACEQTIEEVRREFAQREQGGNLPSPPPKHNLSLQELIQRSRPKTPLPNGASSVSWYAGWLFRWTFFAFPDSFVRDKALDAALQQQWKR